MPQRITLDLTRFCAVRDAIPSPKFTPREFQILACLLESVGEPVSRRFIFDRVWENLKVSSNSLDVHLVHLRAKISPLRLRVEVQSTGFLVLHVDP